MQIAKLDHENVRTAQMDAMITWYSSVLGLRTGDRPDFPFSGAWLYAGDSAVVHLVETDDEPGVGSESTLKLEHFAFAATGREQFEEKLSKLGQAFQRYELPDFNLVQYNLWDPDGNHIHIDFPDSE